MKWMTSTEIARVAYEVNRAYCRAIGDDNFGPWEDAPSWQKDTCIAGVQFHRSNPGSTPADGHDSWLRQKESEGWVHGEVKNPEAQPPTHPCILPYDQLPLEQRVKDHLFIGVVRALTS